MGGFRDDLRAIMDHVDWSDDDKFEAIEELHDKQKYKDMSEFKLETRIKDLEEFVIMQADLNKALFDFLKNLSEEVKKL